MTFSPRISFLRVALLACALLACLAPGASAAVHWPGFGGDAGRSGAQPVDAGVAPLEQVWRRGRRPGQDLGDRRAAARNQRVAYGTSDGVVHIRRLADGGAVGGADVSNEADAFGPVGADPGENGASVSFADTSTETALGQLFVAHNEAARDRDRALRPGRRQPRAAVRRARHGRPHDRVVAASRSAARRPLLRRRRRAVQGSGRRRADADASSATARTGDVNANPLASPTLLYLGVDPSRPRPGRHDRRGDSAVPRLRSRRGRRRRPRLAFGRPAARSSTPTTS